MTTVINNPGKEDSSSATGIIISIIILVVVAGLFVVYVLPRIRNSGGAKDNSSIDVNVKLPASDVNTGGNNNSTGY
jgi:hypothetical protein